MDRLLAIAESHGLAVTVCALPGGKRGMWVPELRRIFLSARLTPDEERAVLAHELGHVHYRHACDLRPGERRWREQERQANRYAARLLIDPARYAELEAVDSDQHALAEGLGVPVDLVFVYEEDCLTRVRGMTYAHARDGVGQWAHRESVA